MNVYAVELYEPGEALRFCTVYGVAHNARDAMDAAERGAKDRMGKRKIEIEARSAALLGALDFWAREPKTNR